MNNKVLNAGSLILIFYFLSQGIRLVANIYVARLLPPEVFGLIAAVLVIQQGVSMLSDVGLDSYLITHSDYKNSKLLNNVWTIQVFRGLAISIVILLIGLTVHILQNQLDLNETGVMGNELLPLLIYLSALMPLITGCRSMARLTYTRELKRMKLSVIELFSQLVGVIVMLVWASYYPSVWALAVVGPISKLVTVTLDYALFKVKHQLSFDKQVAIKVYHFGKWIFLSTAMTYLAAQGDKLFLSFTITPTDLGLYAIAFSLAAFMVTLVQNFSSSLWLPHFSNSKGDLAKLKKQYLKVRVAQDSIVVLFVLIGYFTVDFLISILYNESYQGVAWMLKMLLPLAIAASITENSRALLISQGETRNQMNSVLVRSLSTVILLPLMFSLWGIQGVIIATVTSAFLAYIPQAIKLYKMKLISVKFEIISAAVFGLVLIILFS